jgi:SAM-dependent methyltransferase
MTSTTSSAFFEEMYRANPDPWDFATREYELRRYQSILSALGNTWFRHAVEPGCSIGVLTAKLAAICDSVYAFDLSPTAVQSARARCAFLPNVALSCGSFTENPPSAMDLLVLSEIGYYFSRTQLAQALTHYVNDLLPSGTLVACHWLGNSRDHVMHGDEVHEVIDRTPGLVHELWQQHGQFRLDRWRKIEGQP